MGTGIVIAVLVLLLLILAVGGMLLALQRVSSVPPPPTHEDRVTAAVRAAFLKAGLPIDAFDPDFDLSASGKLNEVVYHAATAMGYNHPLRTVQDVIHLIDAMEGYDGKVIEGYYP